MGAYILKRLLLVIPTLLGIMIVNFALTQFVPGGPIDQIIAQMEGGGDVFEGISGGGSELVDDSSNDSVGARGLPQEFLDQLQVEFNFARVVCDAGYEGEPDLEAEACSAVPIPAFERFFLMMWDYVRFDFGESYFRSVSVVDLVLEKMPVSVTLGLWSTLIAYLVSIPLGIRKAVRDGSSFDTWTSGAIIVGYAIPGFLFAILLIVLFASNNCFRFPFGISDWLRDNARFFYDINPTCARLFPLRGLTSPDWEEFSTWGKIVDYFHHIALPVLASTISAFATLTLLTKNSFLDEIKKQYVITAKAKGLSESRVMYGHVFRNAMLIVISGFPALFIGVFFGGSLIIETLFSLDGLGRLGFEATLQRDYPVMFGTLFAFSLMGLIVGIITDITYVLIDPRIDFERRG
ncbi:microcin C ABC transporter permease YejB [Pseudooctadecabacter sp.]|uniref:microcin C ABC transporter permease YejB n=1 Tax=Pseudooctadecabacter sp. TaxID=1966338 RepID=UPI0035C81AFF